MAPAKGRALDSEAARDRVLAVLTTLRVAFGVFLRARGYLYAELPLWLDEATWTAFLIERPLIDR